MKTLSISAPDLLFDQGVGALCEIYNYRLQVENPAFDRDLPESETNVRMIPNPISREAFAQHQIVAFIADNVRMLAQRRAEIAARLARDQALAPLADGLAQVTGEVTVTP